MRTGVRAVKTAVVAEERAIQGGGRGAKVAENAVLRERLESDLLQVKPERESAMRQTVVGAGSVMGIEGGTCIGCRVVNVVVLGGLLAVRTEETVAVGMAMVVSRVEGGLCEREIDLILPEIVAGECRVCWTENPWVVLL